MSNINSERNFTDLLKSLIRHPSVVAAEHSFFRVLQRELEERGAKVTWYEGVLVAEGAEPSSLMLSAHIDRHGLVCTGPNEFQYAAFVAGGRSDLLGNSVSEELMLKISDRFENVPVYAFEPWSGSYIGSGQIAGAEICERRQNLIFIIKGLEHLVAGTPVAFTDRLRLENGLFIGQLDNVLSAAILVDLFDRGFRGTAFFTAQEEAGRSWRYLLEWFRRFGQQTNKLIVVDTSPYPDGKAANEQDVVLRKRDANALFNEDLATMLEDHCRALNIRFSYKDEFVENQNRERIAQGEKPLSLGSTEMGRIIAASEGLVDGTTLQIPTTGYHTMEEAASFTSCLSMQDLLASVAGL